MSDICRFIRVQYPAAAHSQGVVFSIYSLGRGSLGGSVGVLGFSLGSGSLGITTLTLGLGDVQLTASATMLAG